MGKNIKSYATIPKVQFSREREGYFTAKSPNLLAKIWYGLTVHIRFFIFFLIYKQNFSNLRFSANYTNSMQFAPKNPGNNEKFAPCIHHTLYFQMPDQQQRSL